MEYRVNRKRMDKGNRRRTTATTSSERRIFTAYKQPHDIVDITALDTMHRYFSKTKLVVGMRHPVLWFESFYNFWQTIANGKSRPFLPTKNTAQLIGPCVMNEHICTDHARFHLQIANAIQPTSMKSSRERRLLLYDVIDTAPGDVEYDGKSITTHDKFQMKLLNSFTDTNVSVTNPAFVFEVSQLSDPNATRNAMFRDDFRLFLGLTGPFPEAPWFTPESKLVGGGRIGNVRKKNRMIDICDAQHDPVRRELMRHSRATATWVRDFLLKEAVDRIVISSREYVNELMEAYLQDPCDNVRSTKPT
jgi:hypothetical protein